MSDKDTAGAVAAYLSPDNQQARAAKMSMSVAVDANPDFEAELRRASQRTGVPLESAREFPDDTKRQATLAEHDFDQMARDFPSTTKFLSDPDNARVAHDDVQNMSATEATIGPIVGPKPTFTSYASGLLNSLPSGLQKMQQGIRLQLADLFNQPAVREDALRQRSRLDLEQMTTDPNFTSSTAGAVYGGLSSTIRQLPGVALSVLSGSPAPALAAIGAQTETEAYGKYRARGATPGQALTGAVGEGAVEVGTEMLPMKFLVDNLGKTGAGHFLTGLLAREVPGEQIATLVEDAIDTAIANPDKTWSQYAAERPEQAYQTLIATLTQAGVMEGANAAVGRISGRAQEAQHALAVGDSLTQFSTLAAASRVRERDSATAQEFFQSLMSEGRDTVWITPKALADSGMLDQVAAAVPGVAEQLRAAGTTNTEIRMQVADLMANLAGPELAQSIIPHLADEPGGFTQTTANEYMQSGAAQELQSEVSRVLDQQAGNDAFKASRDAVTAGVMEQLQKAGRFTDDVNQAYASMIGNFFAVQAARTGVTPEEMAARYPLQVRAESLVGAKTLDQLPKSEEFNNLGSGFTVEGGKLMRNGAPVGDLKLEVAVGKGTPHLIVRDIHVVGKGSGVGTAALASIMGKASQYGMPVALTTESMLGKAHQKRLRAYYERLGFKKNKGADKVPGVTEEYVWTPPNTLNQSPLENENFKKWFGDSKVVDKDGKPLVVYHGTVSDFGKFNRPRNYFTSDPTYAAGYAEGDGGNIMPSYLSVKNPLDLTDLSDGDISSNTLAQALGAKGMDPRTLPAYLKDKYKSDLPLWAYVQDPAVVGAIRDAGFDGIIQREANGAGRTKAYIAFKPEQIKSATGNDGTFDANDPNILSQGRRGSLSFGEDITQNPSVISLFAKADLSTFLHESGHFFLEVMNDIASREGTPADIKSDMDAVMKWFGVPDLATWNSYTLEQKRAYHEQFARGFESYLFEGKSPTPEMQGVFSRFRSWLVNVYKSLTALDVTLTDEVRGVFNRMLASADAIAQAERDAGMAGLFKTKPGFMTPEEWTAYQDLSLDATQDAVTTLEARSLRDMRWLSNAKSKLLGQMQKDAVDKRAAVRKEVEAEVMAEPVNRARTFFKHGLNPDDSTADVHRLSIDSLIEMYGGEGDKFARLDWEPLGYGKYGVLAKEGITPDMAAEMFGFSSGDALVRNLLNAEKASDKIEGLTDQRMLERYGDLVDEQSIDRAVDDALHSEARTRFVATELAALNKAAGNRAVLAKAAKAYAEAAVARTAISKLRPDLYTAAARRAGKASETAFGKGDLKLAAVEKQNQLINTYAARAALDAKAEIEKTLTRFKNIATGKDDVVGKTRDMDVVHATRAILAEFGIGTKGKKAADYLDKVMAYDPSMGAILRDVIDSATANAQDFRTMTVEQVRGLRDEIESLWYQAKRSRQMEVDGDLLDRQDVQDLLRARLDEIGVPDLVPGEEHAITPGEVTLSRLQSLRAALRRVEAWASAKDGSTAMGPFRRFIWNTVKDKADAYRAAKAVQLKQLRDLLAPIAGSLTQTKIAAPELGYTFGYDKGGMGKVELLHAILHTGNEGNKKKLLLGRSWATERADGSLDTAKWDAFLDRMHKEGVITKADYEFAQGVWDMLDAMKPLAQKAHREVYGRYFDEVTATPFDTPFGHYRGGYVPAITDSRIVSDAKTRALMEEEAGALMNVLPSTSKGFTKSRVEYNRPLLLDLRLLAQHIDKVLLFSYLEQPIRDVRRVLTSKTVAYPLNRIDPSAFDGLLTPWLNRTARQQVETPVEGSNGLMRFFSVVRSRAGMAAMFANVSNTAQQITGFSIALLRVPAKYQLAAAADFIRSPRAMTAAIAEASPYMANRMENEVDAMTGAINDILLNPSTYENAKAWTAKHTYFLQSAVDNVMGPIIWTGAYNHAMETAPAGMTDAQIKTYARQLADSAVRETQGSTLPEDVSRIETGNAFVRMFTQFAGYFNMQANLLGTEFAKVAQDTGLRKGMGRGFYILLFGFLVPAWAAQAIALAFRGGPDDEDKNGTYLDDWLAQVFGWGTLRNATAMVPVVGQAANALANTFNKKPYDDRISTSPAISMIESAVQAPADVYKLATGKGSEVKTVRDVATLVSLLTGLPVTAAARPAAYLTEVGVGKAKPTGPADTARGLISGAASPASKNR